MGGILQGKRVLVAGGSSGIGLAVAGAALVEGARVVIASRRAPEMAGELHRKLGGEVELQAVDLASWEDSRRLMDRVGNLDHLAVAARPGPAEDLLTGECLASAREAFEVKFWGTVNLIRAARERINPGGSITLTSGIAGERVFRGASLMSAINGATEAICRSWAVELAPIRINAVSPGFVAPKPPAVEEMAARFPLGRLAYGAEVAAAFLALMTNPYQTGTINVVDGGARLMPA